MAVSEYTNKLIGGDPTLKHINLLGRQHINSRLSELVDCLLAHPNVVTHVNLTFNQLTDETGVELARFVAVSSTIQELNLSYNRFGSETYLAVAAALRVNSSLRILNLHGNQEVDQAHIDAAFIEALRLNPDRPAESYWLLYSYSDFDIDFNRLKSNAEQLGHPTLQELIYGRYLGRDYKE